MNIVMIGPFGLQPKATLSVRALPMAKALVSRGHSVTLLVPPWDHPADAGREWEEDGVQVVNLPLPPRLPLLFHGALALRLVQHALALVGGVEVAAVDDAFELRVFAGDGAHTIGEQFAQAVGGLRND